MRIGDEILVTEHHARIEHLVSTIRVWDHDPGTSESRPAEPWKWAAQIRWITPKVVEISIPSGCTSPDAVRAAVKLMRNLGVREWRTRHARDGKFFERKHVMGKDKDKTFGKIKGHVNRMGHDGVHLFMKVKNEGVGSVAIDLKYQDLPGDAADEIEKIGHAFLAECETNRFEQRADVAAYVNSCTLRLTEIMNVFCRAAGIDQIDID